MFVSAAEQRWAASSLLHRQQISICRTGRARVPSLPVHPSICLHRQGVTSAETEQIGPVSLHVVWELAAALRYVRLCCEGGSARPERSSARQQQEGAQVTPCPGTRGGARVGKERGKGVKRAGCV